MVKKLLHLECSSEYMSDHVIELQKKCKYTQRASKTEEISRGLVDFRKRQKGSKRGKKGRREEKRF